MVREVFEVAFMHKNFEFGGIAIHWRNTALPGSERIRQRINIVENSVQCFESTTTSDSKN